MLVLVFQGIGGNTSTSVHRVQIELGSDRIYARYIIVSVQHRITSVRQDRSGASYRDNFHQRRHYVKRCTRDGRANFLYTITSTSLNSATHLSITVLILPADIMPRVVLVTGCSTGGIGYALCVVCLYLSAFSSPNMISGRKNSRTKDV